MAYTSGHFTIAQPAQGAIIASNSVTVQGSVVISSTGYYRIGGYIFVGTNQAEIAAKEYNDSGGQYCSIDYTGTTTRTYTLTANVDISSYANGSVIYWKLAFRYSYNGTPQADSFRYSAVENISKQLQPTAPSLSSPAHNAVNCPISQQLSWSKGLYGTDQKIFFGTDSAATNILNGVSVGNSATSFNPGTLSYSTKYYWKVQNFNSYGTANSTIRAFTTIAAPLPPGKAVIVAPADDATDIPRTQQLQWRSGTDGDPATNYDIYFGTSEQAVTDATTEDSEFKTNQSHTGDPATTQSFIPNSLGNNVDYYWRIDAKNAQGTVKGDTWHFKTIEVQLGTPIEKVYRKKLIALADDKFWYEDANHILTNLGNLEIVAGDGLDLTKPVSIVSAYQKVFIVNGSVKKVVDFSNTRLTVSTMTHIPLRGGILTQANGAAMVIDYVDTQYKYIYGFVTNGTFASGQTASVTEEGVGYNYSVTAVRNVSAIPLYYNWQVYPNDDDTANEKVNGKMPDEPTIVALYRGRIVLSGDKNSPHVIYMSEVANPFNFSYGGDDAVGAAAASGGYLGNIGDIVTACIPYRDDYMLIGCSQTMWLMRGDPASGGSIDQISFTAGLFDKTSFAWDSEDNLYFLDCNGIYLIPAGFGAVAKLTQNTLPDFNTEFALTPDVHRVTFAYDRKKHGLLICKTDVDTGDNQDFWLDLRTSGFFPEKYPADCSVYSADYYSADDPAYRELLLGCRDGYIRVFDMRLYKDQANDTEQPIESYMLIGPGQIASENMQSILTEILFVLSEESNMLDYELYTAKTAQAAVKAAQDDQVAPNSSGIISAGISSTIRPRCRGAYLILKISNSVADRSFAFEKITGKLKEAGVLR
ncbi:MAG: hypothetical protein PHF37_00530 [Phycisphaerae bacterium]|nr:hypothetical protein [Phycisphaerae bacterium]